MSTQEYKFDANIEFLMSIINKSVYNNKEAFIRELISNASDALDKLALEYTNFTDLLPHNEWYIEVKSEGNKLFIKDTGIGMTKNDLINFLGCIAQSGTKKFKENLQTKDKNLIGQFGIGFYSAFLVADKVEVISKHPLDSAYRWESDGIGKYSITPAESDGVHGTTIILHFKQGEEEFLQVEKLIELIKKFSMFIQYPIYVLTPKKEETTKPEDKVKEETEDAKESEEVKNETEEVKKETDEIKEETDEVKESEEKKEVIFERQRINREKELWNKKIEEIPKEELTSFYKEISNDWDDFLECKSWKLEGVVNFNLLLFIPKRVPFNLFDKSYNKNRIKLYCANVFVTDELNCLPDPLAFVTGIVSTDDLPMSISRENVQGTSFHKMLKKMLVNKIIDLIDSVKEYDDFYKEYSTAIKLMARDDDRFVKYLRYFSTKSLNKQISLQEYIDNNKESKEIYLITGLSKEECLESFYLKKYKDKEVLLMCEPADELLLQSLKKFKEIPLKRVTVNDLSQENVEENEFNKELTNLLNLEKVVSNDSLDIPCLITTNEYGSSGTFEKIMQAQNANHPYFMFNMGKKILEVNYNHPLVKRIKLLYDNKDTLFKKMAKAMYNTALLSCGYKINEINEYCAGIYELLSNTNGYEQVVNESTNQEEVNETTNQEVKEEVKEEVNDQAVDEVL